MKQNVFLSKLVHNVCEIIREIPTTKHLKIALLCSELWEIFCILNWGGFSVCHFGLKLMIGSFFATLMPDTKKNGHDYSATTREFMSRRNHYGVDFSFVTC